MASVRALERIEELSDHATLLLDIGSDMLHGKQLQFKIELGWLNRDSFGEMVKYGIGRWRGVPQSKCGIIKSGLYGNT